MRTILARLLPPVGLRGRRREEAASLSVHPRFHGEAGMATLSLTLVMPAVVFLLMTVSQFVVYYHASHLATAAAQEGVRAAQVADGTAADAEAHAQDFLAQAGPALVLAPVITATRDLGSARVEIRAQAPQLVPGIRIAIHAVAAGQVERFDPDVAGP